MLKGKSLFDCKNLFSPNNYENNHKVIKNLFLLIDFKKARLIKTYCTKRKKYKELTKSKISYICHKTSLLSRVFNKCGSED